MLTGFEAFVFTDGTVDNNDGIRLIDDLFYYSKYHDVWNAHVDADAHFVSFGRDEGRDPNAFFSTVVYRSANPDVAVAGVNPLDHFDAAGWLEGRVPSIHFDPAQYLAANPDVAAAGVNPLRHYLQFGYQEGRQPFAPSELIAANGFDYVYYLNHNPDVAAANIDPFAALHDGRLARGAQSERAVRRQRLSGDLWRRRRPRNVNPLDHYNQFGWHEGRDPSVGFDTTVVSRGLRRRRGRARQSAHPLPPVRHPRGPLAVRRRRVGIDPQFVPSSRARCLIAAMNARVAGAVPIVERNRMPAERVMVRPGIGSGATPPISLRSTCDVANDSMSLSRRTAAMKEIESASILAGGGSRPATRNRASRRARSRTSRPGRTQE